MAYAGEIAEILVVDYGFDQPRAEEAAMAYVERNGETGSPDEAAAEVAHSPLYW